jgi:hypothetical protein
MGATRPAGTDWALGIEARARALTGEAEYAETAHREAIDHSVALRCAWISPERICSTASGCVVSGVGVTLVTNCARPTTCSPSLAWRRSPNCPHRAARDRRPRPQAHLRDEPRPDRTRSPDRAPRERRRLEPTDRGPAVHQPRHCRVPPPEGVHQARRYLASTTRPSAA